MGRPLSLNLKMAGYLGRNLLKRRKFPMVTMLEPLEKCNLSCVGCGRIKEYKGHLDEMLSVEKSLEATSQSNAPIVSVAGGEPLLHPNIDEIVTGIMNQGRYVYLCTNGLLLEDFINRFEPKKKLCLVVHLDGLKETHDRAVGKQGVFQTAVEAIKEALNKGFRVCTNTTIFSRSNPRELHDLFAMLTQAGIEGILVSPAFSFDSVGHKDLFLKRKESIQLLRKILDPTKGFKFYNNPLYLDFLRGDREYKCAAWMTPTYTPLGWRVPCYSIVDKHVGSLGELFEDPLWESYGVENDPRCANCMMHSGFEPATILEAGRNLSEFGALIRGFGKPIIRQGIG